MDGKIRYLDITDIIEDCMDSHLTLTSPSVEDILGVEREVYERIESRW